MTVLNFFQVLRKAVYKSLKGNLQRRYTMERLHIYPDENVPDDIKENIGNVIKRLRPVPIRLDTYSEDYIKQFPKIWNLPKDYIIR